MQKWLKTTHFCPKNGPNFLFKTLSITFVEHPTGHIWSKFQIKSFSNSLKLWRSVSKKEMLIKGKNVKNSTFLKKNCIFWNFWFCHDKYFSMQLNSIIIGMLYKTFQLFLVSIIRVLWFRSLKMGQNLLQFQANLVKNCVNLHYVLYHNFYNNLNKETSEPILEYRFVLWNTKPAFSSTARCGPKRSRELCVENKGFVFPITDLQIGQ